MKKQILLIALFAHTITVTESEQPPSFSQQAKHCIQEYFQPYIDIIQAVYARYICRQTRGGKKPSDHPSKSRDAHEHAPKDRPLEPDENQTPPPMDLDRNSDNPDLHIDIPVEPNSDNDQETPPPAPKNPTNRWNFPFPR